MSGLQLRELRLKKFKSYRNGVMPLTPLTVLIGRNGSGKSNALDALEILSRLAAGDEVRDALDGTRKDQNSIRGGGEGCAPDGGDIFTLGVTVGDGPSYSDSHEWAELDVTIQVRPHVRIISERFFAWLPGIERKATVLSSPPTDPDRSDINASIFNNRRGPNPLYSFRSNHLLTGQLPSRLAGETDVDKEIIRTANASLGAVAGVFQLDPVPHLMRDYVPEQDATLRRTGENLSATIARMRHDDHDQFRQLVEIVQELPENEIRGLDIGRGSFGEVMIALKERRGRRTVKIPARQMSDGMLRMLAIATALLSGGRGLDLDLSTSVDDVDSPPLCLVLEELENGLHPSQAARVLDLVRTASAQRHFQVVMTTHSPALLNALHGDDHLGVLVCERTSGSSVIRRLVDLPGYLGMMAQGGLGDSVTSGRIATAAVDRPVPDLHGLLGIG